MIKITLQDSLDELGVTRNWIAVNYKIRPATLHSLVKGDTSQIRFDTLTTILDALNDIAIERGINKEYTITDVIDYEYIFRAK